MGAYPQHIRELNSIRFVAAMWIVLFHLRDRFGTGLSDWTHLIDNGPVAVDVFFVLSGFIMAHVYLAAVAEGRFRYGQFLLARIARIYPLHLAVLAAFLAAIAVADLAGIGVNQSFPPEDLPANLALVHAWGVTDHLSWNGPSWSISAEWFAYLCFPMVATLLLSVRAGRLGPLVVVVLPFLIVMPEMNIAERTYDFAMLRIMPEFVLGGLLYLAGSRFSMPGRFFGPLALLCLCAMLALAHFDAPNLVIAGAGAGLIYAMAEMAKAERSSLLSARPLVYLGDISYAIYMVHMLVLLSLAKLIGSGPVATVVAIAVVLAVAALAYRFVEVPCRAAVRRVKTLPASVV